MAAYIRCGELCRSCGNACKRSEQPERQHETNEVECPECSGRGFLGQDPCPHCKDGFFEIPGCPKQYVDAPLTEAINIASFAMKGQWPLAGGLLDQSAWFVDLVASLESYQNAIDNERAERQYG